MEARCPFWSFPAGQISDKFLLNPLSLPSAFTIEAQVESRCDRYPTTSMFSVEKSTQGNCTYCVGPS